MLKVADAGAPNRPLDGASRTYPKSPEIVLICYPCVTQRAIVDDLERARSLQRKRWSRMTAGWNN